MLRDRLRTVRSLFNAESPLGPRVSSEESSGDDRLESWKEIAGYLKRDVSTVQRWEKREGLPVHRQAHQKLGTVYAYKHELNSWRLDRIQVEERRFGAKVWKHLRSWIMLGVVIGAAVLVFVAMRRPALMNPKPGERLRILPLTSYLGGESSPTFSPEGNQIAFVWTRGAQNGSDIYIKGLREENPAQLTSDGAPKSSPLWSPDGRGIAYFRLQGPLREICVVPVLGGGPERKIGKVTTRGGDPYMAWTPDSESLIVVDMISQSGSSGLFLTSSRTGEKRSLTIPPAKWNGDSCPAISPDGRTLAFVRSRTGGIGSLLSLRLAEDFTTAGKPKPLTPEGPHPSEIMWAAEGQDVLYVSGPEESRTLWRVSASGERPPEPVPSVARLGRQLTLSRQGNRLAYTDAYGDLDIWQVELADRIPVRLISSTSRDVTPDISPDCTRIAFASNRSGTPELWISGSDGSNPYRLPSIGVGTPRWSPDGTQIVIDAVASGNADIYVVSLNGGQSRRITTDPASDLGGSWSRDGRWIYFTSNRTGSYQVWKVDAAAGEGGTGGAFRPIQVTRSGGFIGWESRDGRSFYYAKKPASGGVWVVPANGGEEKLVIESLSIQHNFSVVEDGIYFAPVGYPGGATEIRFYHFLTGRTESVATIANGLSIRNLVAARDRRRLLLTLEEKRAGDIVMVENFR